MQAAGLGGQSRSTGSLQVTDSLVPCPVLLGAGMGRPKEIIGQSRSEGRVS